MPRPPGCRPRTTATGEALHLEASTARDPYVRGEAPGDTWWEESAWLSLDPCIKRVSSGFGHLMECTVLDPPWPGYATAYISRFPGWHAEWEVSPGRDALFIDALLPRTHSRHEARHGPSRRRLPSCIPHPKEPPHPQGPWYCFPPLERLGTHRRCRLFRTQERGPHVRHAQGNPQETAPSCRREP